MSDGRGFQFGGGGSPRVAGPTPVGGKTMTHVRGTFWQNTQQTRRHLKVLAGPSLQGPGSDCKCSGTLRAGCENSGVLKLARVEIFNHRHWQTLGVKTFLLLFSEPARVSKNRWQTEQRGFSYSCCTIVTAVVNVQSWAAVTTAQTQTTRFRHLTEIPCAHLLSFPVHTPRSQLPLIHSLCTGGFGAEKGPRFDLYYCHY